MFNDQCHKLLMNINCLILPNGFHFDLCVAIKDKCAIKRASLSCTNLTGLTDTVLIMTFLLLYILQHEISAIKVLKIAFFQLPVSLCLNWLLQQFKIV